MRLIILVAFIFIREANNCATSCAPVKGSQDIESGVQRQSVCQENGFLHLFIPCSTHVGNFAISLVGVFPCTH